MAKGAVQKSDPLRRWSLADAEETYGLGRWGCGYFRINDDGHVAVVGDRGSLDVKVLVDDLTRRGIQLPILIRFSDLLRSRIEQLNGAFSQAIEECGYRGQFRGVYPIKVNQARKVVEEIVDFGRPFHYGLEAGSKPELLAVMAMLQDPDALVICNGYKDEQYVETALLASKLGPRVVIVAEKPAEIDLIHRVAQDVEIRPHIGVRVRLSARGSGRWESSGGDRSKFGLSAAEIMDAVEKLRGWGELDCFELLHFHLGSQISAIRSIKNALREAARFYTELHKEGCSGLQFMDVGGGLGVDYDGSQTSFQSSMNYTMQEYANDVVYHIQEACDAAEVPHPNIVTESGRAVVAPHSALVLNVLGATANDAVAEVEEPEQGSHALLENLWETYTSVNRKNLLEAYHDAVEYKDQVLQLFNLGHLSLALRVKCERIFWATCRRIATVTKTLSHVPEELEGLEKSLSDTYYCNFSMFQSLPDAWAVDQLFPVMPIHRLGEEPTRRGVLADITCDSDGKLDEFIDLRDVKATLELHPFEDDPYYLGIFLVGAYQEILGDLHNLFGDTNIVHVSVGDDGAYDVDEVVSGDTVTDVLRYVDYQPEELVRKMRRVIENALREGRISLDDSRQLIQRYRDGLAAYTYLGDE